jgi:hypothetical protein
MFDEEFFLAVPEYGSIELAREEVRREEDAFSGRAGF